MRGFPGPIAILVFFSVFTTSSMGQEPVSFPFQQVEVKEESVQLEFRGDLATRLDGKSGIVFSLPLPGGGNRAVQLQPVPVPKEIMIYVDGKKSDYSPADGDLTLWSGKIIGEKDSSVFLSFSKNGSWGRIQTAARKEYFLLSQKGEDGQWKRSQIISGSKLSQMRNKPAQPCVSKKPPGVAPTAPTSGGGGTAFATSGPLPLYQLPVAWETDFPYYQLFGSLPAAANYVVSQFAAIRELYIEDVGAVLNLDYLGFYTSAAADPWDGPGGTGSGDSCKVLKKFRMAWDDGAAPVPAASYHFISGAYLGGGCAWEDVLCDTDWSYGVSGDIEATGTFPPVQGLLTWDFVVISHEIGHNFGGKHTHEFCPPIDSCYGGPCTGALQCVESTLMSYCDFGCAQGLNNIKLEFHQLNINKMRMEVENGGCASPISEELLLADLGFSLAGSGGTPELLMSYVPATDMLSFDAINAPASQIGLLIASGNSMFLPFAGGVIVPNLTILLPFSSDAAGTSSLSAAIGGSYPYGLELYVQAGWIDNGGPNGFSFTNAILFNLFKP